MKKQFITIFLLLGLAFAAVTIVKIYAGSRSPQSEGAAANQDDGKATLVEFWEYYNRATKLRLDRQSAEAAEYYSRALELKPAHQNSLYYLGNMHLMAGHYDEARDAWARLIESNPASARANSQLGNLYSCQERENRLYNLAMAADHYRKAFRLNREETGPLLQLAKIDLIYNRLGAAGPKLDDVLSSNFRSAEAHFLLGYVKWREENTASAQELLNQAVRLFAGKASGPSNVGEGETKSGASPMLAELRCSLFSVSINGLMQDAVHASQPPPDNVFRKFHSEVENYRSSAAEGS